MSRLKNHQTLLGIETQPQGGLASIPDEESMVPEQYATQIQIVDAINRYLPSLNEREQIILIHKYGINQAPVQGRKELGLRFGISVERIRQIERTAIDKLKTQMDRDQELKFLIQ